MTIPTVILALVGCWQGADRAEPLEELPVAGPDDDNLARIRAAEEAARARARAPRREPVEAPPPVVRSAPPTTRTPPVPAAQPLPLAPLPAAEAAPEPAPLAAAPPPPAPVVQAAPATEAAPVVEAVLPQPVEPLPAPIVQDPPPAAEPPSAEQPQVPPPADDDEGWGISLGGLVEAARSWLPGGSEDPVAEAPEPTRSVRERWLSPTAPPPAPEPERSPFDDGFAALELTPSPVDPDDAPRDHTLARALPKGVTEEYTQPVPSPAEVEQVPVPVPEFRLRSDFDPSTVYDDLPAEGSADAVSPGGRRAASLKGPTAEMFSRIEDECSPAEVEPLADIGGLTTVHRACMEVKIGSAESKALRNRLSLALIANATAQQDPSWVGLVERHLAEIDSGNATLALRLGVHHLGRGNARTAYRLGQSAIDHRAAWTPETYEDRTWAAYQLRAAAAQAWWQRLFEDGVDFDGIEAARLRTVRAATDWAQFARHIERKGTVATKLCREAGAEC